MNALLQRGASHFPASRHQNARRGASSCMLGHSSASYMGTSCMQQACPQQQHAGLSQTRVAPFQSVRRKGLVVHARYGGGSMRSGLDFKDRVLAALPYLLPFLNAFTYGRYLFYMYPALKSVIRPILPAVAGFHSLPFASLIAFFGIYIGLVNNKDMSRFTRFNAMQAMLLDILLVLPRLLETIFTPPTSGWGLQVYANSQSFVWVFVTTCVVFGMSSALMGTWARIPFIADAADQQVR